MDRLVIVAPLRAGASDEARKLIENGPPFDSAELGFDRHGVYLSGDEAVFVFEGAHAKEAIDELLEEDSMAGAFARWRALALDAGRVVIDWATGDVIFSGGPHPGNGGVDWCTLLG